MTSLLITDAVELVRKNLDELDPNGSIMFQDENGSAAEHGDNASLDDVVRRSLPEAINDVQLAAPTQLLEGEEVTASGPAVSEDGILSFSLPEGSKFLRLVAFRAADSGIVVTDPLPEASPEGRKQLNKYVRGRYDRPRLVLLQGRHTEPAFKYYSMKDGYDGAAADAIAQLSIVEEQFYASDATGYLISRRLRQNIIDLLTAKVMETRGDQLAQSYYQKANNFPTI